MNVKPKVFPLIRTLEIPIKKSLNHPWYEAAFLSSDIKRQYYNITPPPPRTALHQILFWWPTPSWMTRNKYLPLKWGGTWKTSYPLPSISLARIRVRGRQSLWRDHLDLRYCRQVIPERRPGYRCKKRGKKGNSSIWPFSLTLKKIVCVNNVQNVRVV